MSCKRQTCRSYHKAMVIVDTCSDKLTFWQIKCLKIEMDMYNTRQLVIDHFFNPFNIAIHINTVLKRFQEWALVLTLVRNDIFRIKEIMERCFNHFWLIGSILMPPGIVSERRWIDRLKKKKFIEMEQECSICLLPSNAIK